MEEEGEIEGKEMRLLRFLRGRGEIEWEYVIVGKTKRKKKRGSVSKLLVVLKYKIE